MSQYWQVTIHSVWGTDLAAFKTEKEAWKFALEKEEDTDHIFGTEIKWVNDNY